MGEKYIQNDRELFNKLGNNDTELILTKTKDNTSGVGEQTIVKKGDIDSSKINVTKIKDDIVIQKFPENEMYKVEVKKD